MIDLASPWIFACALLIALGAFWRLKKLPLPRRRRPWVWALTSLSLIAGALAAGGLEWRNRVDRMALVFVLDHSRSVADDEGALREGMREALASKDAEDLSGLVVFADEGGTEALPSPAPSFAGRSADVGRDATDIGAGLRRALSDLPADYAGRLLLMSDGLETTGDALGAAALAASRGVPVDVFPIERDPRPEMAVERVRVPDAVRPGEPVEVRVVTRASHAGAARLQVFRDGEPIADGVTQLRAGTDVLVVEDSVDDPGVHRYDAVLTPSRPESDEGVANNRGGAFVRAIGGSQSLVVSNDAAAVAALVQVLEDQGSRVRVLEGHRFPEELSGLATYDFIAMHDVTARQLSEDQLRAIRSYVRDLGGGLLMAGARESFGLGGYTGTPVEEAMPVRFDLRQRRERLSLAMVIAIDRSGSMGAPVGGGRNKLDLANEAASRSAALLSEDDRVGVMHVDTSPTWTQPMTTVTNPAAIARVVRRAGVGGGGIYVDVTMQASYRALLREEAQLKHLLLFSDGSDSAQMGGTREQVRDASRAGITTSIVSMGRGVDTPELEVLSRMGGGRFYIVEDLTELPRIFTQETMEASRAALREEPFSASLGLPSPITRGLDFSGAPMLLGHAIVNARPRSSVLLWAADEEPLLATWRHGLGQSAVFTTDLGSELGGPWLRWEGLPTMLDRLSRSMQRQPQDNHAVVGVRIEGGQGRVFVDAVEGDGRAIEDMALSGTVAGPNGEPIPVALRQSGAGRYEGVFDASDAGPYLVSVEDVAHGAYLGSAGAVRTGGDELRGDGTNHALLSQIAALSGGEVVDALGGAFGRRPPEVLASFSLVPYLLMLSLLCMLLSVAARRLSFPSRQQRRTAAGARKATAPRRAVARKRPSAASSTSPAASSVASSAAPSAAETEADDSGDEDEPPDEPPSAPATLAEQLLQRKKKR